MDILLPQAPVIPVEAHGLIPVAHFSMIYTSICLGIVGNLLDHDSAEPDSLLHKGSLLPFRFPSELVGSTVRNITSRRKDSFSAKTKLPVSATSYITANTPTQTNNPSSRPSSTSHQPQCLPTLSALRSFLPAPAHHQAGLFLPFPREGKGTTFGKSDFNNFSLP
jgi:hypothetical protein